MTMSRLTTTTLAGSVRRASFVGAAALLLALSAVASAQVPGGPGPGGGPGMHAGFPGAQMLEAIRSKLNLDTSQQMLFESAVAQGKAAREAGRAEMAKVRDAMRAELAKADPDLQAMAVEADGARARNQAAHQLVRSEWLKLYATLNAEQMAVVKAFLSERMNRAEGFRQRMHEHRNRRGG